VKVDAYVVLWSNFNKGLSKSPYGKLSDEARVALFAEWYKEYLKENDPASQGINSLLNQTARMIGGMNAGDDWKSQDQD